MELLTLIPLLVSSVGVETLKIAVDSKRLPTPNALEKKEVSKTPSVEDIELIMKPAKLVKRKELLLRILRECYSLRGRCVPTGRGASFEKLVFATQCTLPDLGNFVIHLLRTKEPTFM